jgi:hypothetical protein
LSQTKEGEKQQQAGDVQPSPEYQFAAMIQAVPVDQRARVMDVLNAMARQAKAEQEIKAPTLESKRLVQQYPVKRKAPIAGAVLFVLSGAAYIGWCHN